MQTLLFHFFIYSLLFMNITFDETFSFLGKMQT